MDKKKTTCFEAFPDGRRREEKADVLIEYGFLEKTNSNGPYYYLERPTKGKIRTERVLNRNRIRFREYRKVWGRGNNYRDQFFKKYHAPYRCAYCGRRIKKGDLQVDHVVPVAQTKKGGKARTILILRGIGDVNDVRNLVPSCSRCNQRKSDKMGIWIWRGYLGRHGWYWAVKRTVLIAILIYSIKLIVQTLIPMIATIF